MSWRPEIPWSVLHARGELLVAIRAHLASLPVLEISTPALSKSAAVDPHLQSFSVDEGADLFLQTSPESSLKRVVAAYGQSVFEITHAFRKNDQGQRHNPEFTLLEWYQVGSDLSALMDALTTLLNSLPRPPMVWRDSASRGIKRCSYTALFKAHFGLDPNTVSYDVLAQLGDKAEADVGHLGSIYDEQFRSDCLDYLFLKEIAPALPNCFYLIEFPICQAALAEIDDEGGFAKRFELYWQGIELANGYQELRDSEALYRRYKAHDQARRDRGLERVDFDNRLADASGRLPSCAGVALGIDRLIMVWLEKQCLGDVTLFGWPDH